MKKQLLVILSVILILMACLGVGIAAAEDSTTDDSVSDTSSDSGSDTSSDNSVSDSGSDTSSDSTSDTEDGSSTDDSSATDDSPSTDDSTSESDDSVDDSTTDESGNVDDTDTGYSTDDELELESGAITADESGNVDDTDITDESEYPVDDPTVEDITYDESEDIVVDSFDDNITDDNMSYHGGSPTGPPIISINDTNISRDDDNITEDNITDTDPIPHEGVPPEFINDTNKSDNDTVINKTDNSRKIIIYKETKIIKIDNSRNVYYNVVNDNSVVNNIYFTPTKSSGKAKIIVEDLKDDKCLKVKPAGKIYKIFNIRIDNKDAANNMKNAAVDFKVEKSWLKANGLDKSSIILNMYDNGKWIEVPITITSEDSKYIYFKAKVSKYSTFAITGKTVVVDKVTKQSDSQNNGNSDEEIDAPTKNVVIKLLELIIDLLKE